MNNPNTYYPLFREYRCCVLIPTYNNDQTLATVIESVLEYTDQVLVVNDGSTDSTTNILANYPQVASASHEVNKGKGSALRTGFEWAVQHGYRYVITIDSDGQHKATDLPAFLEKLKTNPDSVIVGARNMGQNNVPGTSSFGHKFSNFWFKIETGISLPDTQSGYRLYPVEALKSYHWLTNKYEFEIEVMVRSAWGGIPVTYVPIDVYYPPKGERITHFRLYRDFIRISILNTFLVLIALLYGRPAMLYWDFKKKSIKGFIDEHIISSTEPDHKIAAGVGLGVFWGIIPIWGYQWAAALFVAHLLRLNKIIVYTSTNISLPPVIPLIIFLSISLGTMVVTGDTTQVHYSSGFDTRFFKETFSTHLLQYVVGSVLLAIIAAIVLGSFSFILLKVFRKKQVTAPNHL